MIQFRNVPLATLNLLQNRRRLLGSLGGIVFAVVLMFSQVGFLFAMMDIQVQTLEALQADILIGSRWTRTAGDGSRKFPRAYLDVVASVDGVASARPLYVESLTWLTAGSNKQLNVRVMAFDPNRPVFEERYVDASLEYLKTYGQVFFDRQSLHRYGLPETGGSGELNGRTVHIVGGFSVGVHMGDSGQVIASDHTYARVKNTEAPLRDIDLGVVRVKPNVDPRKVVAALRQVLPADVDVDTKIAFIALQRAFWFEEAPAGNIFGMGAFLGFIVGMIICYQILFTEVSDRVSEYATLSAMGYSKSQLSAVVLRQALLLSLIGYPIGLGITYVLYRSLELTGIPMALRADRVAAVLIMTVSMCCLSSRFAVRKVLSADPAELFR